MAENGKEMCVTGGTGFIAAYLIRALLNKGYSVRTTVRNPDNLEKIGYLWDLPGAKQRLKILKANLVEEGSFDEAVRGVDGVFHTACPVVIPNDHNVKETFLDLCVKGTLNVLKSCSRSPSVKRLVLTSSCSSIRYDYNTEELSPLDESHWSNPEYCKQYNLWYAYAKTIAEKETWKYAEEQGLDLVVVNPSFVVGPLLAPEPYQLSCLNPEHNESTIIEGDGMFFDYTIHKAQTQRYDTRDEAKIMPWTILDNIGGTDTSQSLTLSQNGGNNKTYPNFRLGFVDIDDVIAAHILAMETPSASGRIICSGGVAHWGEIVKMLKEKYPMYPIADQCGPDQGNATPHTMNTAKIKSLGFGNFKSLDQMFEDCIRSFQEKGLL